MSTWLKPICAIVLTMHVQIHESAQAVGEPWEHIRSFMERDTGRADPEFTRYLRSLTPEEMLTSARQACKEVDRRSSEMRDMPPEAVAELYVMVCLHHYFGFSSELVVDKSPW